MISCKCIQPSWSRVCVPCAHDVVLGAAASCLAALLLLLLTMLLLPLLVGHRAASYLSVSRGPRAARYLPAGLVPEQGFSSVVFFPSLWLSRLSGYHMGQGADATGGTRMLCIGIIDQQPVAL